MPLAKVICSGLVERIGLDNAKITYETEVDKLEEEIAISDHKTGLQLISNYLMSLLLFYTVYLIKTLPM